MLYFLGNCQMDFLSRSVAGLGLPVGHAELASPMTHASHPDGIPAVLARLVLKHDLNDAFNGRQPEDQFGLPGHPESTGEPPALLVLNLFHETAPLFRHERDGFIFHMNPAAWRADPELAAWMDTHCRAIAPNPATYLKRFGQFLSHIRERLPDTPIVLVTRLNHYPAFGPAPYSYLEAWPTLSREAQAHYAVWERELGVRPLDVNRVFGGIWRESGEGIEAHCPFLKIELEEQQGRVTGLHASRDVEHIGPLWARLADKIATFMETGEIRYDAGETPPSEWDRPWQPSVMDDEAVIDRFASERNYPWAEAVGSFFMDLSRDRTPLLAASGEFMPVCHNTLHMIRAYGRIFKNPLLSIFCDTHRPIAATFTDNGHLYRTDYLARLDEIRAHALS
ncbi:SGNH/GDSL hydrolase family protein [uncultured Pseudodesulfovibrio sp.]|uniref:SGNH/GDSL hydrolase family protein n=1 Tax=uncultured Pseudodesulfovibrio sp. TaxID=2035858 RepID=UPI0029C8C8C8|nr:SGNH/GDSL hydrolase family protein [uncultured Pseudodesulfovibrio sp.]